MVIVVVIAFIVIYLWLTIFQWVIIVVCSKMSLTMALYTFQGMDMECVKCIGEKGEKSAKEMAVEIFGEETDTSEHN